MVTASLAVYYRVYTVKHVIKHYCTTLAIVPVHCTDHAHLEHWPVKSIAYCSFLGSVESTVKGQLCNFNLNTCLIAMSFTLVHILQLGVPPDDSKYKLIYIIVTQSLGIQTGDVADAPT